MLSSRKGPSPFAHWTYVELITGKPITAINAMAERVKYLADLLKSRS